MEKTRWMSNGCGPAGFVEGSDVLCVPKRREFSFAKLKLPIFCLNFLQFAPSRMVQDECPDVQATERATFGNCDG